jgi:uncharacterized protein YjeT (DUF2065 family)
VSEAGRARDAGSWIVGWCALAGSLDALTGLLLVIAPAAVLRMLGAGELPDQPVFLRFVGAFVGAVGLSYLYPFVLAPIRRAARLRVVLEVTALERLVVFAFTTTAIATGTLGARWASVPATDLLLAAAQLWLLRRWSGA